MVWKTHEDSIDCWIARASGGKDIPWRQPLSNCQTALLTDLLICITFWMRTLVCAWRRSKLAKCCGGSTGSRGIWCTRGGEGGIYEIYIYIYIIFQASLMAALEGPLCYSSYDNLCCHFTAYQPNGWLRHESSDYYLEYTTNVSATNTPLYQHVYGTCHK